MNGEDLCPHCGAQVHREYEQHQQIMPASCENGCGEFYDQADCADADDEEILAGWWKAPGMAVSNISLFRKPGDEKIIARKRERGLIAKEERAERDREFQARVDALAEEKRLKEAKAQRYIDEALF